MDMKGYQQIVEALDEAGISAKVSPRPIEGQDLRYVTVQTENYEVPPAKVLNALGRLVVPDDRAPGHVQWPQLRIEFGGPGSITFLDLASRE